MSTNQAQSNSNSQDSAKSMNSTINTTALGYLGEIRQVGGDGKPVGYYIDVNLLAGEDKQGKPRYQFMSLRVRKQLVPAIEQAFVNQVLEQGKPAQHSLAGVMMKVEIYGSFFSSWEKDGKHGVNGEGVLMDYDTNLSNDS